MIAPENSNDNTLGETGNNKSATPKVLGVHRMTLHRKLGEYKIRE